MGEIRILSFNFAPKGWAQCNGQLLPINQNQALFSLLGTNYGGNGQTNFGLPNFQGNVPISMGASFTLGERGGQTAHTVTLQEMPMHNHFATVSNDTTVRTSQPRNNFIANSSPNNIYNPGSTANSPMGATALSVVGGTQAHNNMQPFLVLNFCIALQGIYPSQT